ncbi:hypothetical protein Daura_38800 [Dactylosporangium aurantiacum]|uniref:Bacterial bifunctional deaminase-reductase C-terminal domain-containing protein n=1 Tax=Dactylosporangium aurantiacum TaxID=35754 RepID=A0A9Q9IAR1_9ACTN|nr:hypothetical protein [Dactylosporangium aurantiacum]MDG6101628.1 hypothetical protein [Dactylosporangium aurantiacum]UWZ52547.1 hypothetical protein Daura_38800 [Dactylosporangium aurantiacum]
MTRIVAHMQTTLDHRIATADGTFWQPFDWGEREQAHINDCYRGVGTWAMSRVHYEAIVPWWEEVAAGRVPPGADTLTPADVEFSTLLSGLRKVVFTNDPTFAAAPVLRGDLAPQLAALDGDVVLSAGPATLAPLWPVVDELLLAVHPLVLASGPALFTVPLSLSHLSTTTFPSGIQVTRYAVHHP